jgi:hypothetical protein
MASRGFFGDLYDALTGSGPCYRRQLNGCEVRILAFTYAPIWAQPPRRIERQTIGDTGGTIVLPVHVDPDDTYFDEWFCQSANQEPIWLDRKIIRDDGAVFGRWFRGSLQKNGCVFDLRSRTIEIAGVSHDALVQATTSLCRELSIYCLLFEDYSPRTREFYVVRLLAPDV